MHVERDYRPLTMCMSMLDKYTAVNTVYADTLRVIMSSFPKEWDNSHASALTNAGPFILPEN